MSEAVAVSEARAMTGTLVGILAVQAALVGWAWLYKPDATALVHFARPESLRWLLALPALTLAIYGYWRWRVHVTTRAGDLALMRAMSATSSRASQLLQAALTLLALALLIVAWAQPQWGKADQLVRRTGVDVVFALDMSNSMLAQDIAPSRLYAARREIDGTMKALGGDRVGLVVFTAVSFAQSPLTTDYSAMRFYLDKLHPSQMPLGGTSLGRAISDSVELLTGERAQSQLKDALAPMKQARTRLIVLITDGEDHESDPIASARQAAASGIKLVTVGLGRPEGARIPIFREDGALTGYKRDRSGEFVYTRPDVSTLERMARETGGVYLTYSGEGSVSSALIDYINEQERSELEAMMRQRYEDRFMWFLWPALGCLLLALGLSERRRKVRVWGALTLALCALGCDDALVRPLPEITSANEAMAQARWDDALAAYREAQRERGDSPALRYNIGTALLGKGELEQAQSVLASAMETRDPELLADVAYNLGLVFARRELWGEAYDASRQAAELRASLPGGLQSQAYLDAVHHMELAFFKKYPPCAQLDDPSEDNDSGAQATRVEQPELKDLVLCGGDEDWFSIPALVGTQVEISATFKALRVLPDAEQPFLPAPEDLQLTLYDGAGERMVAIDRGLAQTSEPGALDKVNEAREVTRQIQSFTVTQDMLTEGATALLLSARAEEDLEYSYTLTIKAIPPCEAVEDRYEPNNNPRQAAALTVGSHQLHTCPGDEDWFSIPLELGDTLFVDLSPGQDPAQEAAPQLRLELLDPRTGKVLARGTRESGLVTAGLWEVDAPREVLIKVYGEDNAQQGPYSLDLYSYAPCPLGVDRNEPNNTVAEATTLDPQAPMHRYLRLCPDDQDMFKVPLPPPPAAADANAKPKQSKAQPPQEPPPALGLGLSAVHRPGGDAPPVPELELLSATGDQILLRAELAPGPELKDDATQEERDMIRIDRVLQARELAGDHALVRVQGEPVFYHLIQLNPQSSPDDSDQSEQDEQEQDKSEDPQKPDDSQDPSEQDEQSPDQPESKDPGDPSDEGQPKDQPQPQEGEEPEAQQPEPGDAGEGEPESGEEAGEMSPEMRRVEDILRALEESDDNFQMRKALEQTPGRYIDKDW